MVLPESVKLTVIVDNIVPRESGTLLEEHGFSVWIEAGKERILFDAGKGEAFTHNRKALAIELPLMTMLVISHGHYDHTGGVAEALALAPQARAALHPGAFTDRWSIRGGKAKPTMMPKEARGALLALPPGRVLETSGPTLLANGIGVTGAIPRRTAFEDPGGPFFLDTEGLQPDPIEDDMSLWITTPEGLFIITGCCHSGIVNTIEYVMEITGERQIHTLMGGFHLSTASTERLERTIKALSQYDIGRIIPCHCTGEKAAEYFRKALPFEVASCHAGMVIRMAGGRPS